MTGPQIAFTIAQTDKLKEVVDAFVDRAGQEQAHLPGPLLLLLGGVRQIINDGDAIGQVEIDLLVWMLECIFEQFEDNDIDPLLEQAYHKLTGYWYEGFDPWHVRLERLKDS